MRYAAAALAFVALALFGCNKQEQADAKDKAEHVGKQVEQAAKTAGSKIEEGGVTLKVKSAMSLSNKLNTSGINVDTIDKVVHLRGTVTDENQRALAERIAKDTVGKDIQVVNELQIKPAAKEKSK